MDTKTVWLIVPGAGEEAEGRDATVQPGHTAADLLRAADKDPSDWMLQLQRDGEFLSMSGTDDVYAHVKDREKLHIVAKNMVVG